MRPANGTAAATIDSTIDAPSDGTIDGTIDGTNDATIDATLLPEAPLLRAAGTSVEKFAIYETDLR